MAIRNTQKMADRLGWLIAEQKALEQKIKDLKTELIDYGETVEGLDFTAIFVKGSTRWVFDKKAAEKEMGEQWINQRSNLVDVKPTIRITRNLTSVK